ncbi:amino acid ABC transporter substrate-binding protein [Paraglaciecola aquimarina]|uniref:Amino acid ABC transporter substrate-binding protein n=1 Tax=Paraglaciecola algarum TaxID=3050085 RepID=A0ABS9D8W8_9ALTE|nr:amino acid ABC transporter substrate-binding protein [Paraglaciecola sp. G1-23]MCF2948249.1 amino acid ABC transporter substrate-binding protein [Paraglaciecola sp. G1-23]
MGRFLFLLFIGISGFAQAGGSLTILAGINKPPYVDQKQDMGFEIELVRSIVNKMGDSVAFNYVNYGRASKLLNMPGVDGVMSTNNKVFLDPDVLTDPYINYHNVAISLTKNNLQIDKIEDLANYSIVSFQLADKVLGKAFEVATTKSPLYIQVTRQVKQPEMLFRERGQTLVMDEQIFYYMLSISKWASKKHEVRIHRIFPVNRYSIAFKDKRNVAKFNDALKRVVASTEYSLLLQKYDFNRAGQF